MRLKKIAGNITLSKSKKNGVLEPENTQINKYLKTIFIGITVNDTLLLIKFTKLNLL